MAITPGARAQTAVADFYKGKVITITVGTTPGGGYDTDARVVARNIGTFIPGNPTLVVQNIPGAKGLTNANRLYTTAKRDGTVMSVLVRGLTVAQWLNPQGVMFDSTKFNWLVSTAAEPGVAIVWHTAPQQTFEDLRTMETIVGGAGRGQPIVYQLDGKTFVAIPSGGWATIEGFAGASTMAPEGGNLVVFALDP
jgi:tripartite-type tricarboxylate transporter receptor subunit TctC